MDNTGSVQTCSRTRIIAPARLSFFNLPIEHFPSGFRKPTRERVPSSMEARLAYASGYEESAFKTCGLGPQITSRLQPFASGQPARLARLCVC